MKQESKAVKKQALLGVQMLQQLLSGSYYLWLRYLKLLLALQHNFQINVKVYQEPGTQEMLTKWYVLLEIKQSLVSEIWLILFLPTQLHSGFVIVQTLHWLPITLCNRVSTCCFLMVTVTMSPSEPHPPKKLGHLTLLKPNLNFPTFFFFLAWNICQYLFKPY